MTSRNPGMASVATSTTFARCSDRATAFMWKNSHRYSRSASFAGIAEEAAEPIAALHLGEDHAPPAAGAGARAGRGHRRLAHAALPGDDEHAAIEQVLPGHGQLGYATCAGFCPSFSWRSPCCWY